MTVRLASNGRGEGVSCSKLGRGETTQLPRSPVAGGQLWPLHKRDAALKRPHDRQGRQQPSEKSVAACLLERYDRPIRG